MVAGYLLESAFDKVKLVCLGCHDIEPGCLPCSLSYCLVFKSFSIFLSTFEYSHLSLAILTIFQNIADICWYPDRSGTLNLTHRHGDF